MLPHALDSHSKPSICNKQPKSTFLSAHPHAHSSATQSSQTYLRHAVLAYPYANEPSDGNLTFTPRIAQYCMNTLTTALARHRRWTGTREQCASHGDARRCSQMHSHVTGPLIFQSHPSRCIPLVVFSLLHPLLSSNRQSISHSGLIANPAPPVTRELGYSMFIRTQSFYNSNYPLSTTRSLQPLHFPFLPSSMSYTPLPNPLFPFTLLSPISSHALTLLCRYPSRFDPQPFISISTRQSSRSTTTTAQS